MNAEPLREFAHDAANPSAMFSVETEEALLACCLIEESDALARCRNAGLTWRGFYSSANGVIYAALQKLREKCGRVDAAMLAEFLRERGKLEQVGDYVGINRLMDPRSTSAGAPYLIAQVVALWNRRRAHEVLLGALDRVRAQSPWEEIQEDLAAAAGKLAALRTDLAQPISEVAAAARERLVALAEGTAPKPERIITGLRDFDRKLIPFDPLMEDFLVLIMAPPSHGKSSLARNIVSANLARNKRFAVFLLETGRQMFLQSLACELARVNMLRLDELPRDLAAKVDEQMARVESWCQKGLLYVYDDVYAIDDIEARCHALAETVGPLDCAVVDYVQQVRTKKRCYNREQEVADISGRLVRLGKKLNFVVLGLAQMNRDAVKEKRLPRLSDLRESGALGQDAGRVVGIHRPEEDCRGQEQTDNQTTFEQWLVQLKSRNGPTGYIKTWFRKTHTRFEDMRREESGAEE